MARTWATIPAGSGSQSGTWLSTILLSCIEQQEVLAACGGTCDFELIKASPKMLFEEVCIDDRNRQFTKKQPPE
eukprot:6505605-Alexandrium_andersonii.AAC.1